jgi:hypothetical protein
MVAIAGLVMLMAACGNDPVGNSTTGEPIGRDWPEEHRWRISDDVEVLFAYEDPIIDWVAAIFMDHLPTYTWVHLTAAGRISDHRSAGRDAMVAVCAVLADEGLMEEVRARAAERKPYPAFIARAIEPDPCEVL